MTRRLFQDDMYAKCFSAQISELIDGGFVILDQTLFYPASGGVAHDTGKLQHGDTQYTVTYVGIKDGAVIHQVNPAGLQEGDMVSGELDWDRRYRLMRSHTAAHLISGMVYRNLGAKVTGNNITLEQGRIDFNLADMDPAVIESEIQQCNQMIKKDLPVEVYTLTRSVVDNDPHISKLVMQLPKTIQQVRIVDIKDFDRQPDGGCHVRSLGEIKGIRLVKIKNKGKQNRRLYFALID